MSSNLLVLALLRLNTKLCDMTDSLISFSVNVCKGRHIKCHSVGTGAFSSPLKVNINIVGIHP